MNNKLYTYIFQFIIFIIVLTFVVYIFLFALVKFDQLQRLEVFIKNNPLTPDIPLIINNLYVEENLPNYKKPSDNPEIKSQKYGKEILAGFYSQYVVFTQEGFEQALEDDKIIYLEFYTNWSTDSIKQEPEILSAFDNLKRTDVVGFRVNYDDSDTDDYEKDLAQKYTINNSLSKIILKDGKKVSYFPYDWTSYQIINELNQF